MKPGPSRPAALLAVAIALGACAQTGDFGRPEPSVINDTILPAMGYVSGTARGEPPSRASLTDDEQVFRDRAWRFLMPAHERSVFERNLTEFARTHVLPKEAAVSDPRIYQQAIAGPTPSPISRYRRLTADIDADRALIPPFSVVVRKVYAADDIRRRALANLPLSPEERLAAELRLAENEGLVVWVCEKLNERANAYQVALNGLIVEVPDRIAVESERSLIKLKDDIGLFCGSLGLGAGKGRVKPGTAPADRPPPLILKG